MSRSRHHQLQSCYLCRSKKTRSAFSKNGYWYRRCPACGLYQLVLTEPYQAFLDRYYDQGYFLGDSDRCAYVNYWDDRRVIQKNMRVYLETIKQHHQSGKLLDVGCSLGLFMELAEEAGFDPYGIDVSKYAVSKAQKRFGTRVRQTELSRSSFAQGTFKVICFFDLIEHLQDPKKELQTANKLLKKDGLLIIETGNLESSWAKVLGQHWPFFAPPQHLFIFGRSHLEYLLAETGFEVIKVIPHQKWVSLRYLLHLASAISHFPGTNRLSRLTRHHPVGKIPLYLPFGDKIIITAKKKG